MPTFKSDGERVAYTDQDTSAFDVYKNRWEHRLELEMMPLDGGLSRAAYLDLITQTRAVEVAAQDVLATWIMLARTSGASIRAIAEAAEMDVETLRECYGDEIDMPKEQIERHP